MRGTVVMVHCMWGGSWIGDRYVTVLEPRGWRCLRPVLRYHDIDPEAPPDPRLGSTSLLDYAADLESYVRGLAEPPVLLGHSMGGLLSLMLAARGLGRAAVLLRPHFWKTPMRPSPAAARYAMLGTFRARSSARRTPGSSTSRDVPPASWASGSWTGGTPRASIRRASGARSSS